MDVFTRTKRKNNWWESLPPILTCPECGQKAMLRTSGPCKFMDGTLVPELERFQCKACKAEFFDDDAMGVIEAFRQGHSLTESL
jgi:rubredoxin